VTEWYKDWFDEDYLALYAHRDLEEARQFVNALWSALHLSAGVRVADAPCGAGRHSLAFAENGARVVGVDLSPVMLQSAVAACSGLAAPPRFVRGDLRRIPLAQEFQLAANIFSSIGYFHDDAENQAAFSELARLLVPGGVFIMDVVHPSYVRSHFESETCRELDGGEVMERRELDNAHNRIIKRIAIRRGHFERVIYESIRIYDSPELSAMALACGLEPFAFWGNYDGSLLTAESPRLILLAKQSD
jgi:SAM-dependent methyltransferase